MSETLKAILNHWIEKFPPPKISEPDVLPAYVDLPFNIENFCRENDAKITELERERDELKENLARVKNEAIKPEELSRLRKCNRGHVFIYGHPGKPFEHSPYCIFCTKIDLAVKALEFYGNPDNYDMHTPWGKVCVLDHDCEKGVREPFMDIKVGGKLARETLKKMKGTNGTT